MKTTTTETRNSTMAWSKPACPRASNAMGNPKLPLFPRMTQPTTPRRVADGERGVANQASAAPIAVTIR